MALAKTGLLYYTSDTDRFQDIRIKRLKKDIGCDGYAVYEYILNEIYRVRGCFLVWDESTAFDVAEYWGLKESKVNEIVRYCCAVGLFDKALLSNGNVLTSSSIQSRYVQMCTKAKRKEIIIPEEYRIIPEESRKIHPFCDKVYKVNKKKISTDVDIKESPPSASPVALYPLEEIQTLLPQQQIWAEAMCREFGISLPQLLEFINSFIRELKLSGVTAKTLPDAMAHCRNLMRKRRQLEKTPGGAPAKSWRQQFTELAVEKFNTPDDDNENEKPFWL